MASKEDSLSDVNLFDENGSQGSGSRAPRRAPPPPSPKAAPPPRVDRPPSGSGATPAGATSPGSSRNPMAAVMASSMFQSAGKAQAKVRDRRTLQKLDAVSVRDLLQMLFRVNRDREVKEAIVFVLFFSVFLVIALLLHDVEGSFATTDALQDLLLDEEFEFDEGAPRTMRNMNSPYKKNYFEVFRREEMMQWVRGPLVAAMHPGEYYSGLERQALRKPYILDSQRIVGSVRLRQARVSSDSCDKNRLADETAMHDGVSLGRYDTKDGTCFADYDDDAAQTGTWVINSTGRVYPYVTGMSKLDGLIGYTGGPYGTAGYTVLLDASNASDAERVVG